MPPTTIPRASVRDLIEAVAEECRDRHVTVRSATEDVLAEWAGHRVKIELSDEAITALVREGAHTLAAAYLLDRGGRLPSPPPRYPFPDRTQGGDE